MNRPVFLFSSVLLAFGAGCGSSGSSNAAPVAAGSDAGTASDAPASTSEDGGLSDASTSSCVVTLPPACAAAPPQVGPKRDWRHASSGFLVGAANHRGRDLFLNTAQDQWVIGRFAVGAALAELPVKDEEVDIWLNRDCGSGWEKIGMALTTDTPTKAAVEGVEDAAGRVFFQIPAAQKLGPGRHRLRMVLAGDLTGAEVFIEVVTPGTPMFVSDVDGTLTTSEAAEFTSLLTAQISQANPSSPEALTALAAKGYRPMYVTARPEWLVERTRDFVRDRGFPAGIIHTLTTGALPANGAAAVAYKSGELAQLTARGLHPTFVFGNTVTDAEAYDAAQVQPLDHRIFFKFGEADGGQIFGGRRIDDYAVLLPEFASLNAACPP